MTAIVRTRKEAPPAAKAGLALPGLGHLVTGYPVIGLGMLACMGIVAWAAIAGLPRTGELLFGPIGQAWRHGAGRLPLHAGVSYITLPVALVLLYWRAYRLAFPRELSDDERNSNQAIFFRTLTRNRTGMLGFFGAATMFLLVLLTPMIAPFDPDAIDVGPKLGAPGFDFLLGTDEFGRDMFSRLLYGGRISLAIGFVAVSIAATIGTTVGAVAGYFGGWIDGVLMWFVDLLLSLPRLVLLLAIVGLIDVQDEARIFLIVAILGLTGWPGVSRIVRSQVLSLKQQDFIQAARALGFSSSRIVFRHLVPNAFAPVIVYCSLAIGGTILAEAGLSFLNLGVRPPTSTWGTLVNDGREPLRLAPWIATFPGLAIVWAVMSFNLLGDGLRDALDPKLRGR